MQEPGQVARTWLRQWSKHRPGGHVDTPPRTSACLSAGAAGDRAPDVGGTSSKNEATRVFLSMGDGSRLLSISRRSRSPISAAAASGWAAIASSW